MAILVIISIGIHTIYSISLRKQIVIQCYAFIIEAIQILWHQVMNCCRRQAGSLHWECFLPSRVHLSLLYMLICAWMCGDILHITKAHHQSIGDIGCFTKRTCIGSNFYLKVGGLFLMGMEKGVQ